MSMLYKKLGNRCVDDEFDHQWIHETEMLENEENCVDTEAVQNFVSLSNFMDVVDGNLQVSGDIGDSSDESDICSDEELEEEFVADTIVCLYT